MTKTRLLIATATAALIAGSAFAQSPATPPAQSNPSSPSAGSSGSMSGSGQTTSPGPQGGAAAQGGATGAATTGAGPGATTETDKADDFRTKGATDRKSLPNQRGAQEKSQDKSKGSKPETTGQAPADRSSDTNVQQRGGNAPSGQPNQPGRSQDMNRSQTQDGQRGGPSGDGARSGGDTNVNVNLTTEQRTRIKEVIVRDKSAPRVANVNFSISVGTTVPRTVKHVVVPTTIVEIHPAWRGFHYFMVGDQIVIIDPATFRIVAVLEA